MSLKVSLAWMGAAQAASFITQFAASVVLARYLTPHQMGIYAVAKAAVGLLSIVQSFGLQPLLVREEVLRGSVATTAFSINAILCAALSALIFLCGLLATGIWGDSGVRKVLWVLAVTPLFGIPSFLPGALLERNGRFRDLAHVTMLTGFVGAIATIVLTVLGYNYMSLAYANVLSSGFMSALLILIGRSHFSCRISFRDWREVAKFGANMLAISTLTNFSARLCELALGRILGLAALGLYTRASGFNNILWSNIHYMLSRVVLVDFSKRRRTGLALRERYIQIVAIVTAILWPSFGGLAFFAEPLILILFGQQWIGAALPLTFLALASMVLVATTMSWELCTATGNVHIAARVEAIKSSLSVPLFLAACMVSLEAVAFSRILDALLGFLLYRPHLNQMSGTRTSDFGKVYTHGLLLTAAALLPALLMSLFPIWTNYTPLLQVLLGTASGGILWLLMLIVLKHVLYREILASFKGCRRSERT